jgi:hypothetical protein
MVRNNAQFENWMETLDWYEDNEPILTQTFLYRCEFWIIFLSNALSFGHTRWKLSRVVHTRWNLSRVVHTRWKLSRVVHTRWKLSRVVHTRWKLSRVVRTKLDIYSTFAFFQLQTVDKSIRMIPHFSIYFILNDNFSQYYPEVNWFKILIFV